MGDTKESMAGQSARRRKVTFWREWQEPVYPRWASAIHLHRHVRMRSDEKCALRGVYER